MGEHLRRERLILVLLMTACIYLMVVSIVFQEKALECPEDIQYWPKRDVGILSICFGIYGLSYSNLEYGKPPNHNIVKFARFWGFIGLAFALGNQIGSWISIYLTHSSYHEICSNDGASAHMMACLGVATWYTFCVISVDAYYIYHEKEEEEHPKIEDPGPQNDLEEQLIKV